MNPPAPLTESDIRAAAAELFWFHSMELFPGFFTNGFKSPEITSAETEAMFAPFDLAGRRVLDIGAWNGLFTFAAHRRGAHVLATDSFAWEHDYFRGRVGFDLARRAYGAHERLDTLQIKPEDISPALGSFDLTLFLGVFYHLIDPIEVTRRLAAVTRGCLLLETHQDALDQTRPAMVFYPGSELGGDATNWWGPNPQLVYHLLRTFGFQRILYRDHPIPSHGRQRGIFAAWKPDHPPMESGNWEGWIDMHDEAARAAIGLNF